ncbi:alpha/beta fold hydrolase [Nocardioides bigeumensis]|uniref:Alpha/beta hydrolase n=1 Tax=Nocardioides bigeumensis TaxID=433657 RepID=A0ABP5K8Q1_9ACTN
MDLVPKPDQVVAAAGNVAHSLLYGGLADLRPMPRTLVDDGELREVYHYRPAAGVDPSGDPVLLVTPLAAPALCYDLRRGCSLVEHLVTQGRPTYLVEYGEVAFRNRSLGIEHWVDEVVPEAVRVVSEHAGGRPVHLVGWSLGGIFSLLAAADRPELPIGSLTVLGSPVDVKQVPLVAPLRPLLDLGAGGGIITRAYRAMGGVPKPLVGWAFQLASVQKLVTKPLAIAANLDDTEFLAQLEAVDRFSSRMTAYPGRSFGQVYHRLVRGNALVTGSMELGDRTIELASIKVPVLVFAGAADGIAPLPSVQALLPLLTGSRETALEVVPGGHLGHLTGRAARHATWPVIDEWVARWSAADDLDSGSSSTTGRARKKAPARQAAKKAAPVKKAAAKKAAAKKAAAKKAPVKKAPVKKAAAEKQPAEKAAPVIGTNPRRRYGSASSRTLGR